MFENITPEYIKSDLLARFNLAQTREGSYTNSLISPTAYELFKAFRALSAIIPMVYIDETSGEFIDMRAAQFRIYRKLGMKAVANVTFTGDDGTVIPSGTVFLTADNLQYVLNVDLPDATIVNGSAIGQLTAVDVGEIYNVPAGAIFRQLVNITGITLVKSAAAEGGIDPETDASLVERYYAYLRRPPTSGNVAHYLAWAMSVDGVGNAKVIPLWAGNGTVKVIIVGNNNEPVANTLVFLTALKIETERPIGADVTVISASATEINVSAEVILTSSTNLSTVQEAFTELLSAEMKRIAFTEYLLIYNRVIFLLLGIPGVINFSNLLVNGSNADIVIDSESVPVVGTVEVS